MLSKDRRRSAAIALTAGVLIATGACSGGQSETPSSTPPPTEEATQEPPVEEPTPEPTETTQEPQEIPDAGQEVPVGPQDEVPYYDLDQSFDHPPHVADIRVTEVEWDWSPPKDASGMCEYDPAKGRYLAVHLAIESNDEARSYGTPFSGEDLLITDDSGSSAAEYQDWDTLACTSPGEEITVALEPNSSYEGALMYIVDEDASQLRLDFYFDDDGVTPTYVWELADFS